MPTQPHKVPVDRLRKVCRAEELKFRTTEEVPPLEGMIGQERAVQAVQFGLSTRGFGYNIFMSGIVGTGKLTYAQEAVENKAKTETTPGDWCYVYNFANPGQPIALSFPPGKGREFRHDMEELVEDLKAEIPKVFSGEDYERQKMAIIKEFQEERSLLVEELNQAALEAGFAPQWTSTGFVSVPLVEGKPVTPEEFAKLPPEVREELEKKSAMIHEKAMQVLRKVQSAERNVKERIKALESNVGLFAVGHLIDALKLKYGEFPKAVKYLEAVQEEVLANLSDFKPASEEEQNPFLLFRRGLQEASATKYKVNLLISNAETVGAPVVIESNPTYYNLIGRVEYENRMGVVTTDFSMIKAGALHRANGGYLIVNARDLLGNPMAWEALKRVLKTRELYIENLGEQYGMVAMSTLKPEPIPVDVKVILIGNPFIYQILYHYDEDFRKLFKIKADFDVEMDRTPETMLKLARFISSHTRRNGLRHFDKSGVAKVIEYSSRLADHQQKLTTRFNEIVEILCEADAWAGIDGSACVTDAHVIKAIHEKKYRSNKYEEKLQELFAKEVLLLDISGEKVGQVNGLAVLNVGDYTFGKPSRITANTYLGRSGVVNIEREIKLSGAIHSKGVLTLSGYLGEKYAQDTPLTLSCSLTFEQAYEGVDGDSASSTELYAILSSLSGLPVRQSIAVTGSVNQKGEIQPVGGVTHKIEGYFAVCKIKGLTGDQGVMIPHRNIDNLMLSEEVVEAVREGKFHIYAVRTIDEGIEILTGVPAGERQPDGSYPPGTVHYLVSRKLREYTQRLVELGHKGEEKAGGAEKSL